MKKIYLIAFLLIVVAALKVSAQVPTAYQGDYNRMMNNNSMRMQQQMTMQRMMNQRWYYGFDYLQNYKYNFKVVMKDNSVLEVDSKMYADTATHKSYILYVNKALKRSDANRQQKIYPEQTVKISRLQSTFDGSYEVAGIPTDTCWLFKVAKGKINIYSHLSEVDMLNTMYLRAFQVGDGPIQKVDSAALVNVIKNDPKAMKAFAKKDYYKAIDKFNSSKETNKAQLPAQ